MIHPGKIFQMIHIILEKNKVIGVVNFAFVLPKNIVWEIVLKKLVNSIVATTKMNCTNQCSLVIYEIIRNKINNAG